MTDTAIAALYAGGAFAAYCLALVVIASFTLSATKGRDRTSQPSITQLAESYQRRHDAELFDQDDHLDADGWIRPFPQDGGR